MTEQDIELTNPSPATTYGWEGRGFLKGICCSAGARGSFLSQVGGAPENHVGRLGGAGRTSTGNTGIPPD